MPVETLYWHDYETSGASPANDRPWQFAGVRTNLDLEIIGEPLTVYAKPSLDVLPHPTAIRVTGISPYECEEKGLTEQGFISRIHDELSQPGTCGVGYNSLRFDDEVTRYSLWRNFYDPYAREYSRGNSRWDLIDIVRAFYALRPNSLQWPKHADGSPSFKLEDLTAANDLEHGAAHDAMSDVTATLALARALRGADEALFDRLLGQRFKARVEAMVDTHHMTPLVHISGLFGTDRHCLGVIVPLAIHPDFKSDVICADITREPSFLDMSVEEIQVRLFAKKEDLNSPDDRPSLMTIKVNRAPVLLPMSDITPETAQRLGLNGDRLRAHLSQLRAAREARGAAFTAECQDVYRSAARPVDANPDTALYGSFVPKEDRGLVQEVREASPAELRDRRFAFSDSRLPELLFRYRARNWPEILSDAERLQWYEHCRTQWETSEHHNLEMFQSALETEMQAENLSGKQTSALADLERWVFTNAKVLGVKSASV
ncbi:exonuclease I [gamma proteobacterium HIMB55]|nr:exonuclease I [gamma proteobacterium HIMB55]